MKKSTKAIILITALAICFCLFAFASSTDSYTVEDVLANLRASIDGNATAVDVDFNGEINLIDTLLMLRLATGNSIGWELEYYENVTVATSGEAFWDRGVQYPRIIVIGNSKTGANGTLLATFEELNAGLVSEKPGYPIYRSTDDGATWKKITVVRDSDATLQSEWNPHLLELSKPCGEYAAGTILLAGCSVDASHSKKSAIRLYASINGGENFGAPVTVSEGGGLEEGVWEPFLMQLDDGRIVCFYSDDSDSAHAQKIVYKISSDGVNFGEAVEVVASNKKAERPGMAVVTRVHDGSYFMVYEVVDHASVTGNPIFYRTSSDGLDWGEPSDLGTLLESKDGKGLGSAPYCVWTSIGNKCGTIIVGGTFMRKGSSTTGTDYFISTDGAKTWNSVNHIVPYDATVDHCGYSNCMAVSKDGKVIYALNNPIDENNGDNSKISFGKAEWTR